MLREPLGIKSSTSERLFVERLRQALAWHPARDGAGRPSPIALRGWCRDLSQTFAKALEPRLH
jgi:hypothetical protein